MTVREASEICNVHPETIRRWIRDGRLKAHKNDGPKGRFEIDKNDLIKFCKSEVNEVRIENSVFPLSVQPAMSLSQAIRIKAHVEMIINILLEGTE